MLIVAVFTACTDDEIKQHPQIGEIAILNYNDSVTFFSNNGNLTVSFNNVISDSRTINDCTFAYGIFEAKIELSLLYNTDKINIPFTIQGCTVNDQNIYKDTLNYRVFIYRLEPFNVSDVKAHSDYTIKLKVEKL
jgi:hypothetical protein